MSAEQRLPGTTARTVAAVAAVATLALAIHHPTVGAGVLSGVALAVALRGGESIGGTTTNAALLPMGVLGTITTLGVVSGLTLESVLLAVPSVVFGVVLVVTGLGGGSLEELREAQSAAIYGAVVAAAVTVVTMVASALGTTDAVAGLLLGAPGSLSDTVLRAVLAGFTVSAGLFLLPRAALTSPARDDETGLVKKRLIVLSVFAVAVLAVVDGFLSVVVDGFLSVLVVRALLVGVTVVGLILVALAFLLMRAWDYPDRHATAVAPMVVGSLAGTVGPLAVAFALGFPSSYSTAVPAAFALTAVLLVVGMKVVVIYADYATLDTVADPPFVLAGSLTFVVAVAEASRLFAESTVATGVRGLSLLVALAAALFVYRVGQYGRTLAAEVGPDGATRRPQLVAIGWNGAVVGVGLVVAVALSWLSTVLAPTLSVPSTLGVIAGVLAVLAGAWLLLR